MYILIEDNNIRKPSLTTETRIAAGDKRGTNYFFENCRKVASQLLCRVKERANKKCLIAKIRGAGGRGGGG